MGGFAAVATLATTVISGASAIAGRVQQANAAKGQARYQAAVARNNAIIAKNNEITAQRFADDARQQGEADAEQARLRTANLEGRQRAALAANGVLVDQGSAADIVIDTAGLGELDVENIRRNAERRAQGFEAQGANFGFEQQLATQEAGFRDDQASEATSALPGRIFSTVLTSAGSVASKWNTFRSEGVL